ncbi:FGGY-family carbohydrate kinase [Myxosarcina sp. GI1]|uniref:FGGY-family carbohydrate kinase n=1 Tax=Myxosarcina sp. GI1 TaxID=1541065 RepID=UPI00056B25A4|nr:FGGY-family carbohydrate kinase [Myxosarcina sp. GI1]
MSYYLGIDFGTSGARGIVIDDEQTVKKTVKCSFNKIAADKLIYSWQTALSALLSQIPQEISQQIKAIAIDGTSSTVMLCNADGEPIDEPILYNDDRGKSELDKVRAIAPENSVVVSATSSLTKLFWYAKQPFFSQARYFLHQADWLAYLLHGKLGISDYHNALKLGYDVEDLSYPQWLQDLSFSHLYPQVLPPGTSVDKVTPEISDRFALPKDCIVCTGTTDSIAAFLASGASQVGEAVTSLGSTLVLKLLSKTRVEAAEYGVYSHRLGDLWLTGGASNTGGAVLKHFFTDEELDSLSQKIDPDSKSLFEYYPLLQPGERFPINDLNLPPKLTPRPAGNRNFLQGLLAGIARIEALGYQKLLELGASKPQKIYTAGGGAKNEVWQQIRQQYLNLPVLSASIPEAAYGTALLAKRSLCS